MGLFTPIAEDAIFLLHSDPQEPLGSYSAHAFELDGELWQTVMHYYQAMKFPDSPRQMKIKNANTVDEAVKLSKGFWVKPRADWQEIKVTIMTRAVYTKLLTYPDIAQKLIETKDQTLVDTSHYDYFWGCGRDQRGHNHYGKMLMRIRTKLRENELLS